MRSQNEVWQGCSGYWQNQFIHQNMLSIGYAAWRGYVEAGRGIVVCQVLDPISTLIDWQIDNVAFDLVFVPQTQVAAYLYRLELEAEVVAALSTEIATYDPTQAVIVLVAGNGTIDINLLQQLKLSPAECYAQVQHRWPEFQPNLMIERRST
ncbi:MAG: hypothetical protein ACTS2F_15670 [Thainema sp.]